MLDKISDEEVAKIAKLFSEVKAKDMTLVLRNNYNLATFLDVLEAWMNVSSVSFGKGFVDSSFQYTISHEIGSKWSSFLSLMLQSVFKRMGIENVSFEVTDGTVMFVVPKVALRSK
jgi:hypothetical protein